MALVRCHHRVARQALGSPSLVHNGKIQMASKTMHSTVGSSRDRSSLHDLVFRLDQRSSRANDGRILNGLADSASIAGWRLELITAASLCCHSRSARLRHPCQPLLGSRCHRFDRDRSATSFSARISIRQHPRRQSTCADSVQWQSECCRTSAQLAIATLQSSQHTSAAEYRCQFVGPV